MYKDLGVVIYKITPAMSQAEKLQDAFGMRFTGLADPGDVVRMMYRLPDSEMLYPHDILVDRQGRIAYWTPEYEPQLLLSVLEELALPPASVDSESRTSGVPWAAFPNPFHESVRLELPAGSLSTGAMLGPDRESRVDIFDARGVRVRSLWAKAEPSGGIRVIWDGLDGSGHPVPAGVYWIDSLSGADPTRGSVIRIR